MHLPTNYSPPIPTKSSIRSANNDHLPNLRADPTKGETTDPKPIEYVFSHPDSMFAESTPISKPIDPNDLLGRTFLTQPNEKGERFRARVTRKIIDDGKREDPQYDNVKFLLSVDGARADQIVGYNQVLEQMNDYLDKELNEDGERPCLENSISYLPSF